MVDSTTAKQWILWVGGGLCIAIVGVVAVTVIRGRRDSDRVNVESPTTGPERSELEESRQAYVTDLVAALVDAVKIGNQRDAEGRATELAQQGDVAVPVIVETLMARPGWNIELKLLGVLGQIQTLASIQVLEGYCKELKPQESAVRKEVVKIIGRLGGTPSREALIRLLKNESDKGVRDDISKALIAMGLAPEDLPKLDEASRSSLEAEVIRRQNLRERVENLQTIDERGDESLLVLRDAALKEEITAIALLAFQKLEKRGDAKAVEILAERVSTTPTTDAARIIQTNALATLARMKITYARLAVREIALGDDPGLRLQAVHILGSFGDQAMIPLLREVARNHESDPVSAAVDRAVASIKARNDLKGGRPH